MHFVLRSQQSQQVIRANPIAPVGGVRETMGEKQKTQCLRLSGMTPTCQPPAGRPSDHDKARAEQQHRARLAESPPSLHEGYADHQENECNQPETHHKRLVVQHSEG
jgi:hypothetical protein